MAGGEKKDNPSFYAHVFFMAQPGGDMVQYFD
jgi:hypothetical protein